MNAPWNLDDRITVALFAGMGGACDGLEAAGFPVHVAINHDETAIAVHAHRHPHTKHLWNDITEVDPVAATNGRPVRMLWASPDCTHFSVAKGSRPVSKRRRSLAWVVCRWMGKTRPEVVGLENVYEITTWGPLVAKRDKATGRVLKLDGTVAAKGEQVPVENQQLVPDPKRKGRTWRAWVKHVEGLGYNFEFQKLCCADYGVPTIRTRLFGIAKRKDLADPEIRWPERTHAPRTKCKALGLKPWVGAHTCIDWSLPMRSIFNRPKPLADATLRRIARGVMKYVINAKKPFIAPVSFVMDTAHGEGQGRGVSEWPMSEPMRTISASPGKAVVAAHLSYAQHGGANRDLAEPSHTLTASKKDQNVLVAAHMTKFRNGSVGADADEPLPTYTANSHEKRPGGAPPIGVVAATMVQTGYGEREGQAPRALDIENPVGTQVAGGGKEALVAAFLAQHNDGPRAGANVKDAKDPISTITTTGSQQGIVAAALTSLRGSKQGGSDIEEPLPAQSAGGHHEMLILPFLQTYYGSGDNNHDAKEPLHTVTVNDRHGLVCVEVDGQTFVITDILMRMLDPMEGARAHGFAPDSFPETITLADVEKPLTKTAKGHLVGNSVPMRIPQLIAEANVEPLFASAKRGRAA